MASSALDQEAFTIFDAKFNKWYCLAFDKGMDEKSMTQRTEISQALKPFLCCHIDPCVSATGIDVTRKYILTKKTRRGEARDLSEILRYIPVLRLFNLVARL